MKNNWFNHVKVKYLLITMIVMNHALLHAQSLFPLGCPTTKSITPCLLESGCDPNTVTPFNIPYVYEASDGGSCDIGVTRLLARSVEMSWLQKLNNPSPCWGAPGPPPGTAQVNCTPPYNYCESNYCPDRYCELIKYSVSIDATLIARAYPAAAYHEHEFYPGYNWFCYGKRIVDDINYAYDCAGKMRPVIQAFIGEVAEFNNLNIASNDPNAIIPQALIDYYFNSPYFFVDKKRPDPDSPGQTYSEYYSTPRHFMTSRIATNGHADISKVEMRLWFLYQAICCIDMGYTSIHMGIYTLYSNNSPTGNDPGYQQLYNLTQLFRQYALSQPNHMLLLSGETPYNQLSAKLGGTDLLIFDFDSRAMRPREIKSGITGDGNNCNQPISPSEVNAVMTSPCGDDPFPAVVDPCTINSAGGSSGGTSPQGCHYDQVPYLVHWDGYAGVQSNCEANACDPNCQYYGGLASNGPSSLTWGYDDNRWFGQPGTNALTEECRQWWFDHFYCNRRNYHGGNGFLMIPTTLAINYNEINYCPGDTPGPNLSDGLYLITDDASFANNVRTSTMAVKVPTIKVKDFCILSNQCNLTCGNQNLPPNGSIRWQIGRKYYMVTVENKDCSSVYSIHIKDPNGHPILQFVGDTTYFFPEMSGTYQIGVRQDNIAITPPSSFGTREISINFPVQTECCKLVTQQTCQALQLTSSCVGSSNGKTIYNFQLTSSVANSYLTDVRAFDSHAIVDNIQYVSPLSVTGRIQIPSTAAPKIDLLVRYFAQWPSSLADTVRTTQYPSICGGGSFNLEAPPENSTQQAEDLSIYPNPTSHDIAIRYTSSTDNKGRISVYNAFGQVVMTEPILVQKGVNIYDRNIETWPEGVYFVVIHAENKFTNGKFVKSNQ